MIQTLRRPAVLPLTLFLLAVFSLVGRHGRAEVAPSPSSCQKIFHAILPHDSSVEALCQQGQVLPSCQSRHGTRIPHFDSGHRTGVDKILVFALIHGDEPLAAQIALKWIERLSKLQNPRNDWRIVPVLNPDGYWARTRMNADGVDLNRNFPSKNWLGHALEYWQQRTHKNPRRYPGPSPASEPETLCAIQQIEDFHPDFIISVHAPYGVLDFDGPESIRFPPYRPLRWHSLGTYPGSLGQYMWKDKNVPVLTIELKNKLVDPATIQDLIGGFAGRVIAHMNHENHSNYSSL